MVINGAVVENAGTNAKLNVHNQASILREKEIMTEKDATTPAAKCYFYLQCAYIFGERRSFYLPLFYQGLLEFVAAAPSAETTAASIKYAVDRDNLYEALKQTHELIRLEGTLLRHAETAFAVPEPPDRAG